MHYHRVITRGTPEPSKRWARATTAEERLLSRSKRLENGCLAWTGHLSGNAGNEYGKLGYKGVTRKVHRWAYILWVGEIPEGLSVLHKCDFRLCIEPTHLEIGTYKKNNNDAWIRGRQPTIWTKEQILEIRARYAAGGIKQSELGKEFGVSQKTISKLLRYHIIADGPKVTSLSRRDPRYVGGS